LGPLAGVQICYSAFYIISNGSIFNLFSILSCHCDDHYYYYFYCYR
jgi:hypothetical protein